MGAFNVLTCSYLIVMRCLSKINDFRRVSLQTRNMAGKDVTYSQAQPLMQQCITMLFCRVVSVYNLVNMFEIAAQSSENKHR